MITSKQYEREGQHPEQAEAEALNDLIDDFAEEMKKRLYEKFLAGERGWDDFKNKRMIQEKLRYNVAMGHIHKEPKRFINAGALAAFLWNFES